MIRRPLSAVVDRRIPGMQWFFALSRRVRALLVSLVLFVVLSALVLTMPVPYVTLSPGPTYNTLGTDDSGNQIIVIKGTATKATSGHLNMTTVDVSTQPLTAIDALRGWLLSDAVVVPRAAIYPPGKSEQQVNKENSQAFVQSQDSAIAAASCELGYPKRFGVVTVAGNGPSYGKLQPSDLFVSVAGRTAETGDALLQLLQQQRPGSTVPVVVVRAGKQQSVQVKLGPPVQKRTGASLGVTVSDQICQLPFQVDLGLGNQIGGPSAGMMFALGIMDKVGGTDLTGGRFIAGTGTIDASGQVGPIGGIQLKMIAARRAGATVFLAPAANCTDVRGAIPGGLNVIKVSTLHEAVQDLERSAAGQSVPRC